MSEVFRDQIVLCTDDPLMVRAEKIWRLLGFANDRCNMVPALAGYLATYRELDAAAAIYAPKPPNS